MPTDFKIKNIARKRRGRRKIMDRKSTDRENRKDEDGKKIRKREREKREEAERKREGGGGGKWENGKMEYMKNARERIEKGNKLGAKAAAAKKCPEKSERKGQVCKAFLDRAKRSR